MESGGNTPDIDKVRARWRRWRAPQRLVDAEASDFGVGGLARLIPDRTSRLLILPGDPEKHVVDLDDALWTWWGSDFEDPPTGAQTGWGHTKLPTVAAAVFGDGYGDSDWSRYIALHRNAGVEVGLGRDGSFPRDEQRLFLLTPIVARCWAAFVRYSEVVERFGLEEPFEVSLALCATKNAYLAGFAEGWADPGSIEYMTRPCPEEHLLLQRELNAWPADSQEAMALAFSLGAQIEDAWGTSQRRFLAYRGDYEGSFDPRPGRWR
jgi:hypothetical protein